MCTLPKQLREANFLVECVRGKPTPAVSLLTAMGKAFKTIPSAEQEGKWREAALPLVFALLFLSFNIIVPGRNLSCGQGKLAKLPGKETTGARWSNNKGKKLFTSTLAVTHFSIITNATHTHTHNTRCRGSTHKV